VFGEGPTQTEGGAFKEKAEYTAQDARFSTKRGKLNVITPGEPPGRVALTPLGRGAGHEPRRVRRVRLLGVPQPLKFQQSDGNLTIDLPGRLPTSHASAFEISFGA